GGEGAARGVTRPPAPLGDGPTHGGGWMVRAALVGAGSYAQVGGEWLVDLARPRAPDFANLAAQLGTEAAKRGTKLEGPLAGNDWPSTVHLAYLMNQPSYGTTTVEDPAALASELSQLGIRTYLVFNNQSLAERLTRSAGFRPLADLSMTPPPGARGPPAACEVVGQPAGRGPPRTSPPRGQPAGAIGDPRARCRCGPRRSPPRIPRGRPTRSR